MSGTRVGRSFVAASATAALILTIGMTLSGCTSTRGGAASAEPTAAPRAGTQAQADAILSSARLPRTAVSVAESPTDSPSDIAAVGGPLCTPRLVSEARWRVDGMTVRQLSDWLTEHTTPPFERGWTSESSADSAPGVLTGGGVTEDGAPVDGVRSLLSYDYHPDPDGAGLLVRVDAVVIPRDASCATTGTTQQSTP